MFPSNLGKPGAQNKLINNKNVELKFTEFIFIIIFLNLSIRYTLMNNETILQGNTSFDSHEKPIHLYKGSEKATLEKR